MTQNKILYLFVVYNNVCILRFNIKQQIIIIMKKIYILAIVAFAFSLTANSQTIIISDDFELYGLGPMGNQNPSVWTNWSGVTGTDEDIQVSDTWASSGTQSGNVPGITSPLCDALMLCGEVGAGQYTVRFNVYIPSGNSAYWNFQQEEAPGVQWNGEWLFDAGSVEYLDNGDTATYPEDQWFEVKYEINLDFSEISMWVDGVLFLDLEVYPGSQIGAMDFFSALANNDYWIDDILYTDEFLGVDDFSADVFSVYPNPVRDVLNISSKAAVDSITVYDILGKVVLQAQPNAISPSIDMGALASGAYLVNVTIGNASKTIKVIK